jgi:hypothetical protein
MQGRLLGNGYCTRPIELDCAFETVCETRVHFTTGPEFVPILLHQRDLPGVSAKLRVRHLVPGPGAGHEDPDLGAAHRALLQSPRLEPGGVYAAVLADVGHGPKVDHGPDVGRVSQVVTQLRAMAADQEGLRPDGPGRPRRL